MLQLVCCCSCAGFITSDHAVYSATNAWRPIAPPWHLQLEFRLDVYCEIRRQVAQRKGARGWTSLKNIRRRRHIHGISSK